MRNGRDNNSCLFGEELVSYIYDELPSADRTAFEGHLLSCSDCTDEFAAVSESRLGVYEWHRDDFLPLETPVFAIPYARPVVISQPKVRWIDTVIAVFSPARLAIAGGAFALLAIAFGAIYVFSTPGDELLADANISVKPVIVSEPIETKPPVLIGIKQAEPNSKFINDLKVDRAKSTHAQHSLRPIEVKLTQHNSTKQNQVQATRSTTVPRLGTYDEAEDTSLRLADLVADIDTIKF